ncbi:hypothetical protein M8J77_009621 [Diaphorina citri]|nr:hypothetical protein M8J77_009621 [Diaphorina citri]
MVNVFSNGVQHYTSGGSGVRDAVDLATLPPDMGQGCGISADIIGHVVSDTEDNVAYQSQYLILVFMNKNDRS